MINVMIIKVKMFILFNTFLLWSLIVMKTVDRRIYVLLITSKHEGHDDTISTL